MKNKTMWTIHDLDLLAYEYYTKEKELYGKNHTQAVKATAKSFMVTEGYIEYIIKDIEETKRTK